MAKKPISFRQMEQWDEVDGLIENFIKDMEHCLPAGIKLDEDDTELRDAIRDCFEDVLKMTQKQKYQFYPWQNQGEVFDE